VRRRGDSGREVAGGGGTGSGWATQAELPGAGNAAGSPRAAQSSRPAGSVKPPTGFHAAAARPATPILSQPFHGKSFSLTVLTKTGALKPACESRTMFSTPSENSALYTSRRTAHAAST